MTSFQLCFMTLFTMLQVPQLTQFLTHLTVCLSSLYFVDLPAKDVTGHTAESLTKVKNEQGLIHTASHVIIEGNWAY